MEIKEKLKLAREFHRNQRKIDSRKISKEERKKLIERNREIWDIYS